MPLFLRVPVLIGVLLLTCSLGGCGSISSYLGTNMGDLIPVWAGGLPADAPPRPGTPKYDEWAKQHEQATAAQPSAAQSTSQSSADAIH